MTIQTVSPLLALVALGLCLATGVWVGYRYARESKTMQALIAQALERADTDWEDETPCRRPDPHPVCACLGEDPWSRAAHRKDQHQAGGYKDDWNVESWWLK